MDKKTEKKIASRIKYLIEEVDNIIKLKKDINLSSSEKEIKKLDKKVKGSFEMIQHYYNRVKELGGNTEDIINGLNGEQREIIKEIFPAGTDESAVEAKKMINKIKSRMDDIKKYKETMTYDNNEPTEKKLKNKLFSSYVKLGRFIISSEDKEIDNFYNEYWQYTRDFENTKDKYFTIEEQDIIKEAVDCGNEYYEYFREKHKFAIGVLDKIGEAGEKLVSAGEAVGKWGDITQARVWSDNLYKDVFPQVVEEINPNLTKDEVIKESKEMTKRYIGFISSKKEVEKAMEEKAYYEKKTEELIRDLKVDVDKVKREVGGLLGGLSSMAVNSTVKDLEKNPYIVMYDMLRINLGKEKAAFILLYDKDELKEDRKELLSKYSCEELGLE